MKATKPVRYFGTNRFVTPSVFIAAAATFAALLTTLPVNAEPLASLAGRQPVIQSGARLLGAMDRSSSVKLTISLALRDEPGLAELIQDMKNPASDQYGRFLSVSEFTDRFSPTQSDYDAVAAYAKSRGLSVTGISPNRILLDVTGSPAAVESAFNVHLNSYSRADGSVFHEPDSVAKLPVSIASKVISVVGLSDQYKARPNYELSNPALRSSVMRPAYNGHNGYLAPSDIKLAYDLSTVTFTGSSQGIAVAELSGYNKNDVKAYDAYYGLHQAQMPVVLVDGATNTPDGNGGDVEVDLDIDMQNAVAPNATNNYVYIAPNSFADIPDLYNRIATDNLASVVSTSWGDWEDQSSVSTMADAEYPIFQEMAAQGQTVFAASGDYGAYDKYNDVVAVQDPASQPYVCGVGGTTLTTSSGYYSSETAWGGSGGYSTYWSIPSYQSPVIGVAGDEGWASYMMRNVPDVSLNADPNVGYDIYSSYYGEWIGVGGTSAAAPLWSGLVALANQERKNFALGRVGFINADLYNLLDEGYYFDMHDVQTGNNGVYSAGYYYDAVTGLGTYDGNQLLYELAQSPAEVVIPLAPASATATKVTNTSVKIAWTKSLGAKDYIIYRTPANDNPPQIAMTKNLNYTDTTVKHGTEYYYWIKAINAAGYASSYVFTNDVTP